MRIQPRRDSFLHPRCRRPRGKNHRLWPCYCAAIDSLAGRGRVADLSPGTTATTTASSRPRKAIARTAIFALLGEPEKQVGILRADLADAGRGDMIVDE